MLDVTEAELWGLVHAHKIPTHNFGGTILRLRKEDIEDLKIKWRIERELFPKRQATFAHDQAVAKSSIFDGFRDFWYFNDFYILCSGAIGILLYYIIASQ